MRKLLVLLVTALALSACGSGSNAAGSRTLTVLAASSLTGSFTDLAHGFEKAHPGVDVKLVFDSSATLAQQAAEGAPGDVLATADQRTMDQARKDGGVQGEPVVFASNALVLAVPKDNPAHVRTLADLDRHGVDYLTCVVTAPCGAAAEALLQRNGVARKPVSQEVDVKSVLTKVEADEADAGLVYRTDVTASAGRVTALDVPGADAQPNTYWIAVTAEPHDKTLAAEWLRFVTGPQGQAVLHAAGFGTP